jgi:hypothetical protein
MEIASWIASLTDDSARDIANKAGLPARTVQHQITNGKMSVENLLAISIAYNRHPLRTLIDFGIIDIAWANVPDISAALKMATDDQLTEEILRRLKAGSKSFDEPISLDQD